MHEFPLMALYCATGDGDIGRPVQLCVTLHRERVYIFKLFMPIASR